MVIETTEETKLTPEEIAELTSELTETSTAEKDIAEFNDVPLEEIIEGGTQACPGCGILLGLRLAAKVMGLNSKIIAAGEHANVFGTTSKVQYIATKKLKIPNMKTKSGAEEAKKVLCYDGTNDINDIIDACQKCDVVVSCVAVPGKNLAKSVVASVEFAATASVSHPVDYINKVQEALKHKTSFIELLAPCPGINTSKMDPSNTIEAAKMAVESSLFPLFSATNAEVGLDFKLTYRPQETTSVSEYYRLVGITKKDEEIEKEQAAVMERLSLLKKGRF